MTQPHTQRCNGNDCVFWSMCRGDYIPSCATHTPAAPATEYTIEQIAEIDNRIRKERKAEREKVIEILSDLNKYSCEEYEEASLSDNEREMRIHLEYGNRTWGIIKSLRGGATEQGGERR